MGIKSFLETEAGKSSSPTRTTTILGNRKLTTLKSKEEIQRVQLIPTETKRDDPIDSIESEEKEGNKIPTSRIGQMANTTESGETIQAEWVYNLTTPEKLVFETRKGKRSKQQSQQFETDEVSCETAVGSSRISKLPPQNEENGANDCPTLPAGKNTVSISWNDSRSQCFND